MILSVLTLLLVVVVFPAIAPQPTQSATPPAQPVVQPITLPSSLLEQGRRWYEAGRFSDAALVWQQAGAAYQTQGDRLNQALSLSYLSLANQASGAWQQAEGAIAQSLALLQPQDDLGQEGVAVLAQTLNTEGTLQLAMGHPEAALETWQRAEDIYTQIDDATGVLGNQINQAQALQTLGLYRRAQTLLEQVNQSLQQQPDSQLKATGLRSLGAILQTMGEIEQSRTVLEQSLVMTRQFGSPGDLSSTLFSLGNTLRALPDVNAAIACYQEAAGIAPTTIARLEAQVNQMRLLLDTQQWTTAQALLQHIHPQLADLSPSRPGIYLQVNLAARLMQIDPGEVEETLTSWEMASLLSRAVQQARDIQDARAESYALGQLGNLYEQTQQWQESQTLTQQALHIAQSVDATDIAYRWQWQLGRLRRQQGDDGGAIAAYTEAVNLLQLLRGDLVAINPDIQFSFRENVEPVYRELVGLLVQSDNPSQQNLEQARYVIEALQQAELENFFRSACLDTHPTQIDAVDQSAAVVYPIVLSDRLTVILSLPGQPLHAYSTSVAKHQVEAVTEQLLQSLNPIFADQERLRLSLQIYDWLIRPEETALAQSQVSTLVFVLDGALRNLPMAALYDGQRYLIEKYSIAITPGLQLFEPRSLVQDQLRVLIGGLTESRQGFSALPSVAVESNEISSALVSKVFLDQDFTQNNLQTQISETSFPMVHLATHGQFSSNLQDTFILTWNERITIEGLRTILQTRTVASTNPLELLVLSACETAEGDQRATLGLAGLAVRSGARSTLATLWSVNDASTAELMVGFYQALTQQRMNKAESLRQAQLTLLHSSLYSHPFYWAPFILVGNWL